jgi:hypothetical protein
MTVPNTTVFVRDIVVSFLMNSKTLRRVGANGHPGNAGLMLEWRAHAPLAIQANRATMPPQAATIAPAETAPEAGAQGEQDHDETHAPQSVHPRSRPP